MGRKKESLTDIAFKMPDEERSVLAEIVKSLGYSLIRNTRQGRVILPDWRRWAQAITDKEILLFKRVDISDKSR